MEFTYVRKKQSIKKRKKSFLLTISCIGGTIFGPYYQGYIRFDIVRVKKRTWLTDIVTDSTYELFSVFLTFKLPNF